MPRKPQNITRKIRKAEKTGTTGKMKAGLKKKAALRNIDVAKKKKR